MTAALSHYSPSDSAVKLDATIRLRVDDAGGILTTAVGLVLVDPHGTSYTVLSSGAFLSGWPGRLDNDADADWVEVIVDHHPALMTGEWTARVYVSSVLLGSWTFEVSTPLAGILGVVVRLLEGDIGTGRTVPSGTLRHVDTKQENLGALAGAGPTRPFVLRTAGPGALGPRTICGDRDTTSRVVRLTVVFSTRDQAQLEFEQDWARVDYYIRHVLEWPNNWTLGGGWLGTEIAGPVFEELENDKGQVDVVFSHYDLDISMREHHT